MNKIKALLDRYYRETGKVGLWNTNLYTEDFTNWLIDCASDFMEKNSNSAGFYSGVDVGKGKNFTVYRNVKTGQVIQNPCPDGENNKESVQ